VYGGKWMKLRTKIILLAVAPLVIMALAIYVLGSVRITTVVKGIVEKDLKAAVILVEESISFSEGNQYSVDDSGNMYNGEVNITQQTESMDKVLEESGIVATVFYGDTRYITSLQKDGERMVGTKASDIVVEKVLQGNQDYFAENVDVAGEKFFAYYAPFYNDGSNEPVGMVFAGMSQENVRAEIRDILIILSSVALVLCIGGAVVVVLVTAKISQNIKYGVQAMEELAAGNLNAVIEESYLNQKDETGDIVRGISNMQEKMQAIVREIVKRSTQVNQASINLEEESSGTATALEQVERAILDMAEGATSQAEETQRATDNVITMGEMVVETNKNVERLQGNANTMEKSGNKAADILKELERINDRSKASIDVIYEQTNNTNESVQKISDAVMLITAIADETNLLSLNASIEAARAGEQGRGFAVVASQIQKLAEQSNESAQKIADIITDLIEDSKKAVNTMEEVKQIMQEQEAMVVKTDRVFTSVLTGIHESKKDIDMISENTRKMDESRVSVVDIVQSLSAIAEENAAATEQTSASTTEVNDTVQQISQNANKLQKIAASLEESVKMFKI